MPNQPRSKLRKGRRHVVPYQDRSLRLPSQKSANAYIGSKGAAVLVVIGNPTINLSYSGNSRIVGRTAFDYEQKFRLLADRWRRETRRLSSVTQMALHPAYQKIIGMGWSAVPLILREMQERGGHWLWALHAITDEDPAPEGATFREAVQAWLEWGREHNYLT
jgi:hypothetical protein